MKINSIRAHPISVPLKHTYAVATEPFSVASQIIIEVITDDGLTGLGAIHGRAAKPVVEAVEQLGALLTGMDAHAHEAIWAKIFALTNDGAKIYKDGDTASMGFRTAQRQPLMAAQAGIDIALWDLKGKACGLPVWRLLGAGSKEIHAYASGGYYQEGKPPETVADEMTPKLLGDTTRRDRPDLVKYIHDLIRSTTPAAIKMAVSAMMERRDMTPALGAIHAPTLIIAGAEDTLIPLPAIQQMHAAIKGSTLEMIPLAGHLPNLEQTAPFDALLYQFLQKL